jgi:hypothetical protein
VGNSSKGGTASNLQWRLILPAGIGVGVLVTVLFYYLPVFLINHYATVVFLLQQGSVLARLPYWASTPRSSGTLSGVTGCPPCIWRSRCWPPLG